jgi:hypothetical protein
MKNKTVIIIFVIFAVWGITSAILSNAGFLAGPIIFFTGIGAALVGGMYAIIRSLMKKKKK